MTYKNQCEGGFDLQKYSFYDSDLALPFVFIRMKNAIESGTYMYMGFGFDYTGKFHELYYCPSDGCVYLCYDRGDG